MGDGSSGHDLPQFPQGLDHGQTAKGRRADQPFGAELEAGHNNIVFHKTAPRQHIGQGFLAVLPLGLFHAGQRVLGSFRVVPAEGVIVLQAGFDLPDPSPGFFRVFINQQGELIMEIGLPIVFFGEGLLGPG